jgi:ABC-type transport system involved in cytochrome bd biosynthesis fused ATPase/permease subunit
LNAITDAANAAERLYGVFEAETLEETQIHDLDLKAAIEVEGAEFTWDTPPLQAEDPQKRKHFRSKKESAIPATVKPTEDVPFRVKETNLSIPRGQLIAIVGPVGTGKTSLLQGLIGEMRRTSGTVKFGGSVSYCPQSAWIQVSLVN